MNPDLLWVPSLKLREGESLLITLQKKEASPALSQARSQNPYPLTVEIIICGIGKSQMQEGLATWATKHTIFRKTSKNI